MTGSLTKTLTEIVTASKFAIVGLCATAIHIFMVWLLMSVFTLQPLLANTLAFLTAFVFSYLGHHHWSFNSGSRSGNSLKKFFVVAGSAFLLNNFLLVYMLEAAYFSQQVSVMISVFIIPIYSFIGSRFWAFK